MAEVTIRLRHNPRTGEREVVIHYESESDLLPHEHERDHRALAEALVRVGTAAGKKVVALLTDMGAPLGRTVGNAIETREAIEVLHGKGPADLVEE